MPKLNLKEANSAKEWCQNLQEKMNQNSSMAESHTLNYSSDAISYTMRTYGVETRHIGSR